MSSAATVPPCTPPCAPCGSAAECWAAPVNTTFDDKVVQR